MHLAARPRAFKLACRLRPLVDHRARPRPPRPSLPHPAPDRLLCPACAPKPRRLDCTLEPAQSKSRDIVAPRPAAPIPARLALDPTPRFIRSSGSHALCSPLPLPLVVLVFSTGPCTVFAPLSTSQATLWQGPRRSVAPFALPHLLALNHHTRSTHAPRQDEADLAPPPRHPPLPLGRARDAAARAAGPPLGRLGAAHGAADPGRPRVAHGAPPRVREEARRRGRARKGAPRRRRHPPAGPLQPHRHVQRHQVQRRRASTFLLEPLAVAESRSS